MRPENAQDNGLLSQTASSSGVDEASARPRGPLLALAAIGFAIPLFGVTAYFLRTARARSARIPRSNSLAVSLPGSSPIARTLEAAPPQPQTSVPPEELAQTLWAAFDETSWGAPLETWSSRHRELFCKSFHGNMWGGGADRQWSARCSSGPQPEASRWSFYVFGLVEPLVSRLEQFDVSTPMLPYETLTAIETSLERRLAARFGSAEDRSPGFAAARTVPWPGHQRWRAADLEIQLNLSEFDPQRKTGRLQLLARHGTLLEAMTEDERLRLVGAQSYWYEVGSGIDRQLSDDLRPDFPDAATFLVKQQPDPDPERAREAFQAAVSQLKSLQTPGQPQPRGAIVAVATPPTHWKAEDFHHALVTLLAGVKAATRERQPELLLAADRLASRLPGVILADKASDWDWREWREQLAAFGVTYASTSEEPWAYTGTLLQRVWSDYGETDWGERAFLVLLLHGWDTSADCGGGTDAFRTVIEHGLEFESTHRNSKYLPDVETAVAQACETWWSLSRAPTGEEVSEADADVQPAKYQEGAEAARQKAIALYEGFLQTAPQSDQATYARRVLPRLKLGMDTGQRRYYCSLAD